MMKDLGSSLFQGGPIGDILLESTRSAQVILESARLTHGN